MPEPTESRLLAFSTLIPYIPDQNVSHMVHLHFVAQVSDNKLRLKKPREDIIKSLIPSTGVPSMVPLYPFLDIDVPLLPEPRHMLYRQQD